MRKYLKGSRIVLEANMRGNDYTSAKLSGHIILKNIKTAIIKAKNLYIKYKYNWIKAKEFDNKIKIFIQKEKI